MCYQDHTIDYSDIYCDDYENTSLKITFFVLFFNASLLIDAAMRCKTQNERSVDCHKTRHLYLSWAKL